MRTAVTSSGLPVTQPTFQPVNPNIFAAELIVTVRSDIPGSETMGTWMPSYTMCS